MDELFQIEETKSPRLCWLEKHGISVHRDTARQQYFALGCLTDGWGETEDEAITQLALKLGIKLWNEEGGAK